MADIYGLELDDIVRDAVQLAQEITGSLQVDVVIRAWKGDDGFGGAELSDPATYPALYEQKQQMVKGLNGLDVMASSRLDFLVPITAVTPNAGETRRQPLDARDQLTLPDGVVAPILGVEGLVDPTTSHPYLFRVWLG